MADSRERFTRWVLINGNRNVVAGLLVLTTFFSLLLLGQTGIIRLEDHEAVRGIAGGFIPGLIAFLSIVLAINQLVLSQEFGSAGEVRSRVQEVREYRHDVEEIAGTGPSPVLPTGFLSFVVQTIKVEATALKESVGPETDPNIREAIETYAGTVTDEANQAHKSLKQVRPGRINALLPVLEYNDSRQLLEARRLRHESEEALPPETQHALSSLMEALELFSVARIQFRTTYTQRVLARLSRQLLYVGLPALFAVLVLGLLNTSPSFYVSGDARAVLVSALLSTAFTPLAVLSAYLLRVATISERTIAVGPFVSRPRTVEIDRNAEHRKRSLEPVTSPTNAEDEEG